MREMNWKGVGVALVTPFKEDQQVDFDALLRIVDHQLQQYTDYLVVLGSTAETATLSEQEQGEVVHEVIRLVKGKIPVVMGVGGNNTRLVADKLLHFDQVGVDAILSVVPYYNKPSQEGIYQHFKTLAKISPLPLILYNVPSRTGVNMTAETTLRLAHEFESIVGVKEASGIFSQIDAIIKNKPEGFDVISGDDGITLPMMSLGASGVISVLGNAFPAEMVEMVHASLSGDYIQAFIIHQRLIELFDLLMVDGNPSGIKSMLHFLGRIQNVVRLPLVPARAETSEKIKNAITLLTSGCASC